MKFEKSDKIIGLVYVPEVTEIKNIHVQTVFRVKFVRTLDVMLV